VFWLELVHDFRNIHIFDGCHWVHNSNIKVFGGKLKGLKMSNYSEDVEISVLRFNQKRGNCSEEEIVEARKQGLTYAQLKEKFGVSNRTIVMILRRNGLLTKK